MKIIIEINKIKVRKKAPIQFLVRTHKKATKYNRKQKHKNKY